MHLHDGFFLQFALGAGYVSATQQGFGEREITKLGGAGQFAIGGTPSRGLVVGFASVATSLPNQTVHVAGQSDVLTRENMNFGLAGLLLGYYPDPTKGFHLQGVLGFASVSPTGAISNTYGGFGFSLAAGQQWWIGEQWSFGVLGRLQYEKVSASGDSSNAIRAVIPAVLVDITYH